MCSDTAVIFQSVFQSVGHMTGHMTRIIDRITTRSRLLPPGYSQWLLFRPIFPLSPHFTPTLALRLPRYLPRFTPAATNCMLRRHNSSAYLFPELNGRPKSTARRHKLGILGEREQKRVKASKLTHRRFDASLPKK